LAGSLSPTSPGTRRVRYDSLQLEGWTVCTGEPAGAGSPGGGATIAGPPWGAGPGGEMVTRNHSSGMCHPLVRTTTHAPPTHRGYRRDRPDHRLWHRLGGFR